MVGLKLSPQIMHFKIEHYHLLLLLTKAKKVHKVSKKNTINSVCYPLATHITENPHPLWRGCHYIATNMSAAVSQTFMHRNTSHNNTHPSSAQPAVLGPGNTGEQRYLHPQKTVGVCGQQSICVFVWHFLWTLGVFYSIKKNSTENRYLLVTRPLDY